LAYQVIKYQGRNGWTNRDVLRLVRPDPRGTQVSDILRWIVKGEIDPEPAFGMLANPQAALNTIRAFENLKRAANPVEAVRLIREYNLPRECVPTEFLKEASVWEALLDQMPMTAMIRNLGNMSKVGLLTPGSTAATKVIQELTNVERIRKARVHPIALLSAEKVYGSGRGFRGSGTWQVVPGVLDALDEAFYNAFQNVTPSNKKLMLAFDISGSMDGGEIAGVPGLTPREASAAMAVVTARTEPAFSAYTFSMAPREVRSSNIHIPWYVQDHQQRGDGIQPFALSAKQRVDDVVSAMSKLPMGGTDCSLPMRYATKKNLDVEAFVVYTDNETWGGHQHVFQALDTYRQKSGNDAKLVVVGLTATDFSIADPNDPGSMDVVGFDTNAPSLISDFIAGRL
jgi:60 kDa SS-A/Ro ribonucleoprotein